MAEKTAQEEWQFPDAEKQEAAQKEKGLIFAQKFLVFKQDPRAAELLASWSATVRRKTVALNASAQEYAAHNAVREFVEAIHVQIEFANQGVNQPQPRTK